MTNLESMAFGLLIKLDPEAAKRQADKIRADYAPLLGVSSEAASETKPRTYQEFRRENPIDTGIFAIQERAEAEKRDSEFTSAEVVE